MTSEGEGVVVYWTTLDILALLDYIALPIALALA